MLSPSSGLDYSNCKRSKSRPRRAVIPEDEKYIDHFSAIWHQWRIKKILNRGADQNRNLGPLLCMKKKKKKKKNKNKNKKGVVVKSYSSHFYFRKWKHGAMLAQVLVQTATWYWPAELHKYTRSVQNVDIYLYLQTTTGNVRRDEPNQWSRPTTLLKNVRPMARLYEDCHKWIIDDWLFGRYPVDQHTV